MVATSTAPEDVRKNIPDPKEKFFWSADGEPHAKRRQEILKAHPEIQDLHVKEIRTFPLVLLAVAFQLACAYFVAYHNFSWTALIVASWFGGFISHSLTLSTHELTHNLCFESPQLNMVLAWVANIGMGVPSAATFKRYHMEHHMYQGVDGTDVDIPSEWEARLFRNAPLRTLWLLLQPVAYSLRPILLRPKALNSHEIGNAIVIIMSDLVVYNVMGFKALAFLVLSALLGMGIHPMAGHFIAEHYVYVTKQETYSYYGPLNWLSWNVGYHNEHHDFPRVPWSKLPEIRKIAPEFYDSLPHHASWTRVLWDFVSDDSLFLWSRMKRDTKSGSHPKSS